MKDIVIQMGYKKDKSNDYLNETHLKKILKKFSFLKKFQLVTTFIGTIGKTNDLDKVLEAAKLLKIKICLFHL